jgi:hypothetical protein
MKIEGNNNPSEPINFSCDPIIKSITSDLTLLGNALMTRINDPLTILEFISFDSLPKKELRSQLKELIHNFSSCDSDDDRLKFLLEMHYLLAVEGVGKNQRLQSIFNKLEMIVKQAKNHSGIELKRAVSTFQVEVLQLIPGISKAEYDELSSDLRSLEKSIDLNETINAVYEKINMHTQIPFDE